MTLTVENGTGLANADAYVSLDDARAYAEGRALTLSDDDDVLEAAIRNATSYIDSQYRFKGTRLTAGQALEFPRSGLVDNSGYAVTGLPTKVVQACIELAAKALVSALYSDMDRGGMIKSRSVGPISVTYVDGAPVGKTYTVADRLLWQYLRQSDTMQAGPFNGSGNDVVEPAFTRGQMDNLAPDDGAA